MMLIYSWVLLRFTSATNTVFPSKYYKLSLNQLEKNGTTYSIFCS